MMPVAERSNAWSRVDDYSYPGGWAVSPDRARDRCRQLESGEILFFPGVPFELAEADRAFLISQKQAVSRFHKNISYRPQHDQLRGVSSENSKEDRGRAHRIMRDYSNNVTRFAAGFLVPYAGKMKLDFASFRPLEEQGRDLPTHRRNDLLHVDAFPTRPTHGARILRIFTNINPAQARIWLTGEPFHEVAPRLAQAAGLSRYSAQAKSPLFRLRRSAASWLRSLGAPVGAHSAYDLFMLHFHDWLKFNDDFQEHSPRMRSEFPPGCTWLVFTDGVPHAALSGQYALEHTYIIPREALVAPERAPVEVLEKLAGARLAQPAVATSTQRS
jgi:hypothetical protein